MTNTADLLRKKRKAAALVSCAVLAGGIAAVVAQGQGPAPAKAQPAAAPVQVGGETVADKGDPNLPILHYEGTNIGEDFGIGDRLAEPRQIAAVVVAAVTPSPKLIVDVGSHQGEFLEAFMDRFTAARGQWTEPVETSEAIAKKRFARFGKRVDYKIGCPGRDISDGCVPKTADVIITSWVSHHRDPAGVAKFYKDAAAQLPSGGWLINMDHVSEPGEWNDTMKVAKLWNHASKEGPSMHGEHAIATLDQHLADYKAAGIDDVAVVWRSFDVVLLMGRKH